VVIHSTVQCDIQTLVRCCARQRRLAVNWRQRHLAALQNQYEIIDIEWQRCDRPVVREAVKRTQLTRGAELTACYFRSTNAERASNCDDDVMPQALDPNVNRLLLEADL
jgi:hypothetical protein